METTKKYLKAFCTDKSGKVVIFQQPNGTILVWLAALFARNIFVTGASYALADAIAFGALFAWAWMELFQGCSWFRRTLGGVVLLMTLITRI